MIDFYQIHYLPEQTAQMFPWATPYFNPTLTPFFENSVIADLVPRSEAKKIAVCSWNLKRKMRTMNVPPYIDLTYEHLEQDFDVLSFTRNTRAHQMLEAMEAGHKGTRIKEGFRLICEELNIPIGNVKYPIYQNAFCATAEVYNRYVEEALSPAMSLMENNQLIKEISWEDSNYYRMKTDKEFADRVNKFIGPYCPLHTFILERLFSVWINKQDLNVRYL